MFIDELTHYNMLKNRVSIVGKPCIWAVLSVLIETENNTLNITALISKLNSNYTTISKCIDHMKRLQLIEEIKIGKLRLIRLTNNDMAKLMINIIKSLDELSTISS